MLVNRDQARIEIYPPALDPMPSPPAPAQAPMPFEDHVERIDMPPEAFPRQIRRKHLLLARGLVQIRDRRR
jgi:hypothetical protein